VTYNDTLEYLYNVAPAFEKVGANAYKEGLDNTLFLDEYFGHPHRNYHTIHVAGTNGKGSTSHTIAALLQAAGYRVGLYTSPHLVDFNERIRVNGIPIPHSRVIQFVEEGISDNILQPVAEVLPGSEATSEGSTVPNDSPASDSQTWNGRYYSFFELTAAAREKTVT
jgi:folylpolyglutamate synthase/dihydropteroate synthase